MNHEILESEKALAIKLSGEIDSLTAPRLRELINSFIQKGKTRLVLDFSDVSFINSSGLGVLVGANLAVRREGGSIVLTGINGKIGRVFELSRLSRAFEILATVEDGLRSF